MAKRIINNAAARKSRSEAKLDVFHTARRRDHLEVYAATLEHEMNRKSIVTEVTFRNYRKMAVVAKAVVSQMPELELKVLNLQRECDKLEKAAAKQQD